MSIDKNLAETAYLRLREQLLSCEIEPGARLNISQLCVSLKISQGAVREALSRLVSDDLVTAEFNRGYCAASVTVDQFITLIEARVLIDIACLRMAIDKANLEWEVGLIAANHRLVRILDEFDGTPESVRGYSAASKAFNDSLMSACDNEWLSRTRSSFFEQSERYRRMCLPNLKSQLESVKVYREELMKALIDRDADSAVRLLSDHYQQMGAQIAARMKPDADTARLLSRVSSDKLDPTSLLAA